MQIVAFAILPPDNDGRPVRAAGPFFTEVMIGFL
jgi:hypothetical protein